MAPNYGYAGKILRLDLSSHSIATLPTDTYSNAFVGGRGMAARIYWTEVPPGAGAFDAENRLIFALGPLAGVPVIGGSRWGVYGKSPLTTPQMFNYCNFGGRWGAELKFAGYDGLVIHGKAESPVYLFLHDDVAEIKDASALWGKGARKTIEILKQDLGNDVRVVSIGPAGENMAIPAILLADNDATGSAGLGSVMGSKRLKAIAVRGSRKEVRVAHPETLRELTAYFRSLNRTSFVAWGVDLTQTGPRVKKDPCYGCQGKCLRIKYTAESGQSGKSMCNSGTFYIRWAWRHYGRETEVPFHANRLCDDYGLDTWAVGATLDWLYRCYKSGLITQERIGIDVTKIGSLEFIEEFIRMVALRQGFGEVLAQGLERAAQEIGGEAPQKIKHADPYDPRIYLTTALLWAVEPREPIQALHEVGYPLSQWTTGVMGKHESHVTSEVVKGIARRFWGSEAAADFTTIEGKALAAKMIQDRQYAKESLILCDWIYPISDNKYSADHIGDPTLESKYLAAVTGMDIDEQGLYRMGERVFNQQRAALVRDGHGGRKDDGLPEIWHTEPLGVGVMDPKCLVPDRDGNPVSRVGAVVDRKDFEKMKDEYYQLRGWDVVSGLQTRRKLEELNLKEVADDLEVRGFLRP